MRHNLTILSIAALSLFFSCNKMETIQNPDGSITVTASVSMAQTKALTSGGEKTFAINDQLAVIYKQVGGGTAVAISEKLTSVGTDILRDGKYAKFRITFTDPDKTKSVTYVYPANMAKNDGTINYDALYSDQNGTLSKIASDFDLCTKVVSWSGSSLPEGQTLVNQLTVAQFTLRDSAIDGNPGNITSSLTGLTITNGSDEYDVTLSSNSTVWVAMKPITTGDIVFSATDGSNNYTKTVTSQTMSIGTLYSDITVSMNKVPSIPTGTIDGLFTVNASGDQVRFSQGNLQYQASTGTWQFAASQYDAIGSGNSNVSASYSGWIDLFGWGSGNQPTQTSEDPNVYSTFVDWGNHAISNGGNTANQWRTLSESEWTYLIFTRPNASSKRGRATVNGMYCFVLLPDDWVLPSGLSFTPDANNWTNVYTTEQWAQMEAAGAVCFPAAGTRAGGTNNTNINNYNEWCCYWSSTSANSSQGYNLWITSDHVGTTDKGNYQMGASVRLVYDVPFLGAGTESDPYLISSEADWIILANKVNSGNSFTGKFFRQTANINVTTMVGNSSDSKPFSGTYDGDGKTLNLSLNTSTPHTAPFRFIENATIKNVVTTGSVHSTDNHPSGLVGETDGTCTIQNCRVGANVGGAQHSGGIVGHCYHANIDIIGCVYSGTLSPASGQWTGGIIGWGGDGGGHTISISDCLFAGTLTGSTKFHPIGILQNQSNTRYLSNTYYTLGAQNTNDDASFVNGLSYKGKFARSITAGTDVTVARAGATAVYDVSGITSYGTGILYNGVLYAGNGEAVSLTLSHGAAPSGSTFNRYTVSGGGTLDNPTSNSPTLTMTDANQTINALFVQG